MGLIQRAIEAEGIPTISISLNRIIREKVKPPRVLLLDYRSGHPMGNPFENDLQRQILLEALDHLKSIDEPGPIADLRDIYQTQRGKCELCTVEVG